MFNSPTSVLFRVGGLKTPGGARFSRTDIRNTYKVRSSGQLIGLNRGNRFITNIALTHMLMDLIPSNTSEKLIVELGPGPGALTRSLLTRPSRGVLGIEVDSRYNAYLEAIQHQTDHKFRWLNSNVLDVDDNLVVNSVNEMFPDFADLMEKHERVTRARATSSKERFTNETVSEPLVVVANLPFATGIQYAMQCTDQLSRRAGVFAYGPVTVHMLLFQPFAERLMAAPNTRAFGRPSLVQNYFSMSIRRVLTEESFFPLPTSKAMTAAVMSMVPRPVPLVDVDARVLSNFAKIVLRHRTHHHTTQKGLSMCFPPEVAEYVCSEVRVDPDLMPTSLTVVQIARMAQLWQKFLEATNQPMPEDGDVEAEERGNTPSNVDEEKMIESGVLHV
eukprot:PhM_4_TR11923/c0_g1_i1/m.48254/K15266/TFB1M; dimethyladenosine transferase 1, mitochondrial